MEDSVEDAAVEIMESEPSERLELLCHLPQQTDHAELGVNSVGPSSPYSREDQIRSFDGGQELCMGLLFATCRFGGHYCGTALFSICAGARSKAYGC